jgi:Tol biopolymer transport system component
MNTPAPYFFMSYSREDTVLQRKVLSGLRQRGINVWVDIENLIPGSPAWEREIERAIRGAAGSIVLLSPNANDSEWVRREISFGEENEKSIFPALIHGDEDDSIPLRLSDHQRVDLRRDFEAGLDELANALKEHIGVTAVHLLPRQAKVSSFDPANLRKFLLPGLIAILALFCLGGLAFAARYLYNSIRTTKPPAGTITNTPPDTDVGRPVMTDTAVQVPVDITKPTGKIVFTCQVAGDEICIINADGSGWQRLTDFNPASFHASLSPDGKSVLYVNSKTDNNEIYEFNLQSGKTKQLTKLKSDLDTPEISPDNKFILFTNKGFKNLQIWIMDRDGSHPHVLYSVPGKDAHDAVWSPDGSQILFAFGNGDNNKFYIMGSDGRDPRLVNNSINSRGRSDWSINDFIVFDMGGPFQHDVYVMRLDGSDLRKVTNGNNSQGATFSPDGQWIAMTAYTDTSNQDQASCEIYIMRLDGSDSRRLTSNHYCDYQPRWGN